MTIILPHRVYFSIFSRKILVNLWNFSFAPFYLPIFYVISNSVSVLSALTRCHWEKAYSLQMFVYTRMCVLFLWALLLIYLRTIQVQFVVVFSSSYICSWIICKIVVVIVIFSFVGNDTDISEHWANIIATDRKKSFLIYSYVGIFWIKSLVIQKSAFEMLPSPRQLHIVLLFQQGIVQISANSKIIIEVLSIYHCIWLVVVKSSSWFLTGKSFS